MGYIDATPEFAFPVFNGKTYLSALEVKQLEVLFDPIFPSNHEKGVPGALDAKAATFISQLLAFSEEEYYKIPEWKKTYREGLKQLNLATKENFQKELIELSREESKSLLQSLEKGEVENLPKSFDQKSFFEMLVEHCLKGCFSDPRWGGNHKGIMWRWLGWIEPAQDIKF